MAKGAAIICLALHCMTTHAQSDKLRQGSRSMAMGGSGIATPTSVWAAFHNPSSLAFGDDGAAVAFVPAPFGLSELARGAAETRWTFPFAAVSLALQGEGFDLYRETGVSVSAAAAPDDAMRVGATVTLTSVSIARYGAATAIGVDLGVGCDLASSLTFGAFAGNVNAPSFDGTARTRRAPVLGCGLAYRPSTDVELDADLVRQPDRPFDARAGLEFLPVPAVAFRAGARTDPASFTAGAGVRWAGFSIDYAFQSHPDLGAVHGFALGYFFRRDPHP